jgi:GNAT superfamily N-acetyltransferase
MKLRIDILEAEIDGAGWLQIAALHKSACVATATVFWTDVEGKLPELCNLFVQEAHRRQGVAQALIAAVASRLGRPYCLHALRESPAYWLYRKLGFLEIGQVNNKPENVWMLAPPTPPSAPASKPLKPATPSASG